jgi:hypothetical protein
MSYKIVVARYNETIDWLKDEIENCIIFNKGDKLDISNEFFLKNVGRESDTYLNYIIENYDSLPDVVVFTQASISDHRGGSYAGSSDISYLLSLKNEALTNGRSSPFQSFFDNGQDSALKKNWNYRAYDGSFFLQDNYRDNSPIVFIDWFKKNIDENYPNPIYVYLNGIFALHKDLILQHPVEYYKSLIKHVNHHINPAEGHFFERSWFYIFKNL